MDKIEQALKQYFGHESFRAGQREIIEYALDGCDAFVLMPTGGGKSLVYQLPALLMPGLTVVISPLIALMQDQVDRMRANGLPASFVNSTLNSLERIETGTSSFEWPAKAALRSSRETCKRKFPIVFRPGRAYSRLIFNRCR